MSTKGHRLLIDEPPLQVLPSLALAIGLNEAIVLQQLHYWLQRSQHVHEDRRWIYNTYEEWQAQFPFWSLKTVRNVIGSLEKQELVLTGNFNQQSTNRTKWYTIDYNRLDAIASAQMGKSIGQNLPDGTGKLGQMHPATLATSSSTETTTETTAREQQQPDEELLLFITSVTKALEDESIAPKVARELAEQNPDLAADWLEAKREWANARDPAGLLVAKIRAGEEPPRPRKLGWR